MRKSIEERIDRKIANTQHDWKGADINLFEERKREWKERFGEDTPEESDLRDAIENLTKEDLFRWITDTMVFAEIHEQELDKAREKGLEEVYRRFCEWEMPRNLSKEQKETFDDLLGELFKLQEDK